MGSIGTPEPLPAVWRNDNDAEYEEARIGRVFNHRRPRRYPRAVVQATCEEHIIDAVKLAKRLDCRVSVRSGGHSWAAWSVRDDAVLIDLGQYKHVSLDETRMVAEVSPSTTGRILNGFLGERGYMFCGGHCPDVGVGGFLLQGGMGWNCKNWGWACEKIVAVDVVTADGELLHCNSKQNQELYWMVRGAGPGFPAIVTKFYLEVRKSFSNMMQSFFAWPKSRTKEIIKWTVEISPDFDESTEIVAVSQTLPGDNDHTVGVSFVTFKNSVDEAQAALERANRTRPHGCIVEDTNRQTSLADQYCTQAAANPEGHRYCAENAYISNDEDVPVVLEEAFTTLPHPKAFCIYFSMNPCSQRTLTDMALSMQSDHYFATYTVWEDEKDDERCRSWVRNVMRGIERHSEGAYLGDSDFQVRRTRFWSDQNGKKLMELRQKWDPQGRMCGYLDDGDSSGTDGLKNVHEWKL